MESTLDFSTVPFLKWAGGKRWLTAANYQILPNNYDRYIEPFVGSGAVFFNLINQETPFILSDLNQELINCYKAIKSNHSEVKKYLNIHNLNHDDDYYYRVRASQPRKIYTNAAKFIYLNRTCFNGLYRVNLNGEFNVPRGTSNNVVLETDNFKDISKRLRRGKILHQDFEKTMDLAKKGDFVFIDPPYTVKHNFNGFIKYNEKIFSWEDQERLKESVVKASKRGVQITMTNADHKSIRALYKNICEIEKVDRASLIAGNSLHRGKISEVLLRIGWDK